MEESFFGYGSCSAAYDKRRHLNVLFQLFMIYRLKADQQGLVPKLKMVIQMPTEEAAEFVCNDILSYDEHNFLNLIRERLNLADADFVKIMSAYGCTLPENKTPAGYTCRQNQELLVQMLTTRCFMQPEDPAAFNYLNGVIARWASGMRGIDLNKRLFLRYDSLWREALSLYPSNFQLEEVEDYVISNL